MSPWPGLDYLRCCPADSLQASRPQCGMPPRLRRMRTAAHHGRATAAGAPRLGVAARRQAPVHFVRQAGSETRTLLRGAYPRRLGTEQALILLATALRAPGVTVTRQRSAGPRRRRTRAPGRAGRLPATTLPAPSATRLARHRDAAALASGRCQGRAPGVPSATPVVRSDSSHCRVSRASCACRAPRR